MATVAKTFSVRNGLDVANTIVLDSNRNISNIIGANVTTANATTINATNILTSAGLNVTDQANNARDQANTARDQANNAYAEANLKLNLTGGTVTGNINVNNYLFANGFYSTNKNTFPPNLSNTYGERLRLYDFEQAGHPNYAIGVEANYIWAGTDENNGGTGFKWYGNTTQAAVMRSNGTLQLSNTVEAKVFKANGTGTAIDASQGNILTNQVTGTKFRFLAGANTVNVDASGATANYTFTLPANSGLIGQVLVTDGNGLTTFSSDIYTLANISYGQANTARDTANGAYAQANGAYAQANGAYGQANGAYGQANDAYGQANGAYGQANGAYAQANVAANTVRVYANSAGELSNKFLNFINTASIQVSVTDNADGNANISFNTTGAAVSDAYNQANAARDQANSAYNEANLKLNLTGGTVTGNLTVQGNLFLTGNATYINVATLKVNDSIIQLSTNSTADAVDIGFIGHYSEDGGTTNLHAGFFRHASDNVFYIVDGYPYEPTNNVIDIASANLAWLRANVNAASLLIDGSAVSTQANLTLAHNQANTARDQANSARDQANTARDTANGAYAQANGAYAQANGAYAQANGAYAQANGAYAQANGAYAHSNIVYAQANAAFDQANSGYNQANSARDQANAAYADANTRVLKAGDTMTGLLTITTTGTGLAVANANVTSHLTVGTLNVRTNTVTTSTTGQVVLDTFALTAHASAKYFVQANSGTDYTVTEIIVVHDGTNIYLTEYGTIQSGPSIGTFSADVDSGNARLLFTANNNVNTIRSVRYGVLVP